MELRKKLSQLRKEKGLTQLELAEMLNVSRQAVSRWEVGSAVPTVDNLVSLSEVYGVPLDDLVRFEDTKVEALEETPAAAENHLAPAPARSHTTLVALLLAVLILGVGILIGINLQQQPEQRAFPVIDQNSRVTVGDLGTEDVLSVGWLEKTLTDIEEEAKWLEEQSSAVQSLP